MTAPRTPPRLPRLLLAAAAAAIAACGGDDGGDPDPDARPPVDGAAPDAPPVSCQHQEADDDANDAAPEATGLVVGPGPIKICGQIDARAPQGAIVDVDRYRFAVDEPGHALVRIEAAAGHPLAALTGRVTTVGGALRGDGLYVGDHLVFGAALEDGELVVEVVGRGTAAPGAAVRYEIVIGPDDPDARCARVDGPAAYAEQADGAGNVGNDVVLVVWEPSFSTSFTPLPTDAPEPSGAALVISSGLRYRVEGTAGVNANAGADDYQDRDTYVIYTGGQTNELAIQLAWEGDDADLDWLLFPVPGAEPPRPISAGATVSRVGPERNTTAVLPSTSYWLWVGAFDGAAAPRGYGLTICGATHRP